MPDDISNDTLAKSHIVGFLTEALDYNSTVIAYAAVVISAGKLDQFSNKKVLREFKKMEKQYHANVKKRLDLMDKHFKED